MSGHINSSGSWKELKSAHCKVNGEWKEITNGYANDNGTWKKIYSASKIYSIIYDKSLASDPAGCLTYDGACAGFTPMKGGSGDANEGSWAVDNKTLFDSIKVGYLNGSTFVEQSKSEVSGSTSYNCFTRIPKIYQKVTDISDAGDNSKVRLDLSLKPFSGGTLHPAFIMDNVELTYKDIGRYVAYNNSSKLESKSGVLPTVSTTRTDFRTYAKANGDSYGLLSYYDWDLVNKLYLLAFKNFNSQMTLSPGYTNKNGRTNTGSTDGHSWIYGPGVWSAQIALFGIEDWWGNIRQIIDNYLTSSKYIYASNTASPSDDINDMTLICANPGSRVTKCPLKCNAGLNDFFIGMDTLGSLNSSGMCDYQYFSTLSSIASVGGQWSSESSAGAFYFDSSADKNYYHLSYGTRMVHWE